MQIKLTQQENESGDKDLADQGFGQVSIEKPPAFDPIEDMAAASDFFTDNGFVVLQAALA